MMLPWIEIESALDTLVPVEGGFSNARRGFVTLRDGGVVFVKIATNADTLSWLQKEIRIYEILPRYNFRQIPTLLSYNDEMSMLALEVLSPVDGWDWSSTWTEGRLTATLAAMDELDTLQLTDDDKISLQGGIAMSQADNGWVILASDSELVTRLEQKLPESIRHEILSVVHQFADSSARYDFQNDSLGHHDVRADNCAWNAELGEIRLIDWNWLDYGDRRIDLAGFLVHVHQNGIDITKVVPERLDIGALEFLAGFWFKAAVTPIWPGGPEHLRDFQLASGVTAFHLAQLLKK